jgi:hypothetical protein
MEIKILAKHAKKGLALKMIKKQLDGGICLH